MQGRHSSFRPPVSTSVGEFGAVRSHLPPPSGGTVVIRAPIRSHRTPGRLGSKGVLSLRLLFERERGKSREGEAGSLNDHDEESAAQTRGLSLHS